jgi:hypothetical protein
MDRLAYEHASGLEAAARRRYSEAVEQAGKVRRAAKDAAYLARDRGYDQLREQRSVLLRAQPRDEAALANTEAAMRAFKTSPPPVDLSAAEAEHTRATRAADHLLDTELKSIKRRLMAGELDPD